MNTIQDLMEKYKQTYAVKDDISDETEYQITLRFYDKVNKRSIYRYWSFYEEDLTSEESRDCVTIEDAVLACDRLLKEIEGGAYAALGSFLELELEEFPPYHSTTLFKASAIL